MSRLFIYIKEFLLDFFLILNEMSPYLLLGLFFAGVLKVFLPERFITKYLQKPNTRSVINATLLGIPLPLCSCGVLPTGISLYKSGASKGATNAFITATPQTGVDSILVTYAMLGLPMAIIRPIVALFSGILSGIITNKITKHDLESPPESPIQKITCAEEKKQLSLGQKFREVCKYAFYTFLSDIARWLIIGTLIAAAISVLLPDNFFTQYISHGVLGLLLILVASTPLYICATASVPIAAVLLSKGISPGAILVFLMAGPATNAASFTLIGKMLGKRSLFAYLITIIGAAVGFGLLMDAFLPAKWFEIIDFSTKHVHGKNNWFFILKTVCTLLLVGLLLFIYIQKHKQKSIAMEAKKNAKIYRVSDMSCNHCKNSIEKALRAQQEVEEVSVNLAQGTVQIVGNISAERVRKTITDLGFTFEK